MMKCFYSALILSQILSVQFLHAQDAQRVLASDNFILLVVPESDTVTTSSATYRLSASTKPRSRVTINDKPFHVYPSGAFCGELDLSVGENIFTIQSTDGAMMSMTKTFVITRTKPIETTRSDTLMIENEFMLPARDVWLREGDILELQFKGTPGRKATFMDGSPMIERPLAETRGIGGIYRGIYSVKNTDTLLNHSIPFRLEDSTGNCVTAVTQATVSFMADSLPRVGVTKGDRPYLNTGLGEDRLGGYKFSIINPEIRLKITGKVGPMYRVALTDNHEAWINEGMLDLQPFGSFYPSSLTGSMNVYHQGNADVVALSLVDKLPYTSQQLLERSRIVVDVYGATSNTNWITQQLTTKEIANVSIAQAEKGVFRITIELKHKQMWGYEIGYSGTTLMIKVRRQPDRLRLKALTFALDAGHGGEHRGAVGCTGALEKNITLSITEHLREILEDQGARVILTRSGDSTVSMQERYWKTYQGGADMLISVHANSIGLTSDPSKVKGAGTFYKHIGFRPLSQFILNSILDTGLDTLGNVGGFNFMLNAPTEFPNVLVETAFISNPEDEMKLLDDEFRRTLAEQIVDGVEEFLDYCDE